MRSLWDFKTVQLRKYSNIRPYEAEMKKTNRFPAWAIVYVLFSLLMVTTARGQCVDGTYGHEDRKCCLCAVGHKVVKHCETNLQYGKCDFCDPGKFSIYPSGAMDCDDCRVCNHTSENLEVERECTAASDTKCRCRPDSYCSSYHLGVCHLCSSCAKCGAEGIKVPCAGNKNTVCNEEIQGSGAGKIVGIVIGVALLVIAALVAVYLWKKRGSGQPNEEHGNLQNGEMQHLNIPDVNIQTLIPGIAVIIGWKDMKNVALQSGISKTRIENCQHDNQNDREEQTIQLLQIYAEEVGRGAADKLIKTLKISGKQAKAEEVAECLRRAASDLA